MVDEIEPMDQSLIRLGLKVVGGTRGAAVSEFIDKRREARSIRRLSVLKDGFDEAGASEGEVSERIAADDTAQELFEETVRLATSSRYDSKIRYLGRCRANALASDDDAAIDLAHLRLDVVEGLEAAHVRLLALVDHVQKAGWVRGALERQLVEAEPTDQIGVLQRRSYKWRQFDRASFAPLMAVLVRTGLVEMRLDIDLEVEVDLSGDSLDDASAEATPSLDSENTYAVTALGREILDALAEPDLVSEEPEADPT